MRQKAMYSVYIHTNKMNGKKYVGITKQRPERRWQKGKGYDGTYFGNAIAKYSWDGFTHEVIMSGLTKDEACDLEITLIKSLKTNNREYGYNVSEGGQTAENLKSKYGLDHPNHKRVKMIDAETGEVIKTFDSQTSASQILGISRKAITKACRGQIHTYRGYIWEYADIEFKKPERKGCGNYKHDKIQKAVVMIDNEGRHYFKSIKEASKSIGVASTTVSRYLSGTRKDKQRRWFYAS